MVLYINGSNRKENCSRILNDLKEKDDKLIELSDMSINYCLGCSACANKLKEYCVIEDDMQEIYEDIKKTNKIVIATPIYMNHITGLLKNVIDRFNPYTSHEELLKGKTLYIITVGQMSEEENQDIAMNIRKYFESIGEFMKFNVVFLKNFTSGVTDDVSKANKDYEEIIKKIKEEII